LVCRDCRFNDIGLATFADDSDTDTVSARWRHFTVVFLAVPSQVVFALIERLLVGEGLDDFVLAVNDGDGQNGVAAEPKVDVEDIINAVAVGAEGVGRNSQVGDFNGSAQPNSEPPFFAGSVAVKVGRFNDDSMRPFGKSLS